MSDRVELPTDVYEALLRLSLADDGITLQSLADAYRLALATAEARHAEREAMWRELRELERGYWLAIERSPLKAITSRDGRIDELRRALGLEP